MCKPSRESVLVKALDAGVLALHLLLEESRNLPIVLARGSIQKHLLFVSLLSFCTSFSWDVSLSISWGVVFARSLEEPVCHSLLDRIQRVGAHHPRQCREPRSEELGP